jgi:GAF domain-containing protein
MTRKRLGIFGASDESFELLRLLAGNPEVEIVRLWHADRAEALERARRLGAEVESAVAPILSDELESFAGTGDLHAIVDAGVESGGASFADQWREAHPGEESLPCQVLTPLTARLLFGYGVAARDRKTELLQALTEVVDSVDLTVDADALFRRMLEIAMGVTGADGGSLMLLDEERRELRIRVAVGVEPELWPKIRVHLGEGIAGRVAADARPLLVAGKADRRSFHIVRERFDVESAVCVPLVHEGRVLGVLNLHHKSRQEAFGEEDLEFAEQLAHRGSQIIARAQAHEALRHQAARYEAVREVRAILARRDPLLQRLHALCTCVAARAGHGIATVYLHDPDEGELRLAATSLEGGGFGGEYRVVPGEGIDGRVAEKRRPAFLRGADGSVEYVALPLLAGERLVGVLSVQAGGEAPRGRAAEEMLLEMGAAVAEAVAQADREARMAARATRMSAINETGIRMLSSAEIGEVTRLATSSACMILEADHAVLRLQDRETGRYVIRSYYGAADGPLQERLFRLDKRVSVDVIRRRTAALVRDVETSAALAEHGPDFRSLMAAPLKREGRVVGTLAVYDKVATDRFYAGRFNDDDLQVFARLVGYVERAVANAAFQAQAREHRNFDEETGLPNTSYLSQRLREETARAAGREAALALATCCIENLEELRRRANPVHAHRVVLRVMEALRAHLRDFDVLGRVRPDLFAALLPEPGPAPSERVFALARATADAISKDERLNEPVRVELAFGYAIYPNDGDDPRVLLERAGSPRIRMV